MIDRIIDNVAAINAALRSTTAVNIGGFNATQQKYVFAVPEIPEGAYGVEIENVRLVSDVATSGSTATTKEYAFQIVNLTDTEDLLATAVKTGTTEITADTVYEITPDQNNTGLGEGTVLELQITKTGSPTDLSSAEVVVFVDWKWAVNRG